MLYENTLDEVRNNINTGVEYEIALYYALLAIKPSEQAKVLSALETRNDADKIMGIIGYTSIQPIIDALKLRGLSLIDVTFETQNDEVGPADVVMIVVNGNGTKEKIGLSVKFFNTCTLNGKEIHH